jgi:hypothetical protein
VSSQPEALEVGPEHRNVMPAICWAAGQGWIDPESVNLSIACILEVRAEAEKRARMTPEAAKAIDEGAWNPARFPPLPEESSS